VGAVERRLRVAEGRAGVAGGAWARVAGGGAGDEYGQVALTDTAKWRTDRGRPSGTH
jgi:hypothetical protein